MSQAWLLGLSQSPATSAQQELTVLRSWAWSRRLMGVQPLGPRVKAVCGQCAHLAYKHSWLGPLAYCRYATCDCTGFVPRPPRRPVGAKERRLRALREASS